MEEERVRKVDISKFSKERLEAFGIQLGKKIGEIINNTLEESNRILNIYDLQLLISYNIVEKPKEEPSIEATNETIPQKKKRGRPKKLKNND